MRKPFDQIVENLASLTIGTVETVGPSEIKVLLELEAPQATALNAGVPAGFPRINSYVLIPNEVGAVVGMIVWLGIERSNFPKRKGLKDFDLIDLPFPLRKLILAPIGTLLSRDAREVAMDASGGITFKLDRGVTAFPSVGDPVLLPTPSQLKSIVEASGCDRRVTLGASPMAGAASITADPDKLFGRHLAILGNTGSGKSCTVAGLIRWSLDAAKSQIAATAANSSPGAASRRPNARFVVLDPNGEYQTAFSDLQPRVFRVHRATMPTNPEQAAPPAVEQNSPDLPLQVPAWLWNGHEWAAFAAASEKTQRPLLMRALRELRATANVAATPGDAQAMVMARNFRLRLRQIESFVEQGPEFYGQWPGKDTCGQNVLCIRDEAGEFIRQYTTAQPNVTASLRNVQDSTSEVVTAKTQDAARGTYKPFTLFDFEAVLVRLRELCGLFPQVATQERFTEDSPAYLDVDRLADHLELLASAAGGNASQHIATMTTRIRTMLQDQRLQPIISGEESRLRDWLESYIGSNDADNGEIAIIDLALVPSDVIYVVIAVIARMVFEAAQRHMKLNEVALPTVLVLEEAHTFINRHVGGETEITSAAQMCRQTFERVAREGRKFGLGLVLSSQRPAELSQTVLAQCNTFILHRIVNDDDQKLVCRLVPDAMGGLLKELSSLPSRRAILLGWATPIPALVDVTELPLGQRPRSADPDFWHVWTRQATREIDWEAVERDWLNAPPATRTEQPPQVP